MFYSLSPRQPLFCDIYLTLVCGVLRVLPMVLPRNCLFSLVSPSLCEKLFSEKPFIFTLPGTSQKNRIIIFVPYCSVWKNNLIIKFLINRISFISRLDLSRLSSNLPCYKTI